MRNKKRRGEEAFLLNIRAKGFYQSKLRLIATSCFKWEGLPPTIPERFIENNLYTQGKLAFADDPLYGIVCCKCTENSYMNMYDEALAYNLYASNGYNGFFKRDDVVLLRNNKDEIPTLVFTDYYIKKLFELDRTIDVNVVLQKVSKILTCPEEQKLTIENLLMQYEGNIPFIMGYDKLNQDIVADIDLSTEFVADKLMILKGQLWSECLEMLGINNANTDKKERLITDEVNANNQLLQIIGDVFLESRQECARQLNEKFGLNVTVKRKEVKQNGELHDNARDDTTSEV